MIHRLMVHQSAEKVVMRAFSTFVVAATVAATSILTTSAIAAPAGDVSAVWKPAEIHYAYFGFTTAYNCDALEDRLQTILKKLGAHPKTRVLVSGCEINRPSRNSLIRITTATPQPAAGSPASESKDDQAALKRLGVTDPHQTFSAQWQTVNLGTDRKLNLEPGDCEMMEGLAKSVFPKLNINVVQNDVSCTPNQISIVTPTLKVEALVAQST
jgi:hypothetical protein